MCVSVRDMLVWKRKHKHLRSRISAEMAAVTAISQTEIRQHSVALTHCLSLVTDDRRHTHNTQMTKASPSSSHLDTLNILQNQLNKVSKIFFFLQEESCTDVDSGKCDLTQENRQENERRGEERRTGQTRPTPPTEGREKNAEQKK